MSDPVTNVEIEDVLSSIRRLVSDGDKARTRDPAPVEEVEKHVQHAEVEDVAEPESQPVVKLTDRLVLTPAFLVVDDVPEENTVFEPQADARAHGEQDHDDQNHDDQNHDEAPEAQDDDGQDDDGQDDDGWAEPEHHEDDTAEDHTAHEPLELTNMIEAPANDDHQVETIQTPDRSELVATIAELEAAISNDPDEYEPDGSEVSEDEPMAQTIAWPGTFARSTEGVEEADSEEVVDDTIGDDIPTTPFQHRPPEAAPEFDVSAAPDVDAFDESEPDSSVEPADIEADVYADDDIDDLIEAGGVSLDEEALRALVAEVVREELTGPLGERITRNVRKLVRREIYRVLSSQEFD